MGLRPGYKRTEVGVIPEDWIITPFIRAVGSYIDYRGRTPRKLGLSWGGGDILALSADNVQMGRIDPDKEAYLGSEELYRKWMVQGECEKGDVLLTMEAPLGNVAQIPDSRKYILSQRVLLIKPKDWLLRGLLAHYMKGVFFQSQLSLNSTGSTAKGIQRRKLDNLDVYFPPTRAEQEAIAEALSGADALIESLEQLIAKKRHLKQGAMVVLLRPRDGWVLKPLGESCEIITKGTTPTSIGRGFVSSGISFLKAESIGENGQPIPSKAAFIDEHTHKLLKRSQLIEGDILISIAGVLGRVGLVKKGILPANTNQALAIIRLGKDAAIERGYLFYYLRSPMIEKQIGDINVQAAQANISLQNVRDFQIVIPPSREEQAAIAAVLSDMDAEIAALEARLAKARQIKLGMMHNLLTGRIRLV